MAGEACEAGTLPSSLCWSMMGSGPGHLVCVQRCDRPGVHLGSEALLLKSFFFSFEFKYLHFLPGGSTSLF